MVVLVRIELSQEATRQEVIRDVLAGRMPEVPPSAVLEQLMIADLPNADRCALLRDVATDGEVDTSIRVGAVSTLVRIEVSAALRTAVDLVGVDDDVLASAAARALGKVGGPDILPLLERIRLEVLGELTRRAAAFAVTLIVHRFGLTDYGFVRSVIDVLPVPNRTSSPAFASVAPAAERRARALARLSAELPWVNSGHYEIFEIQCGPRLLEIAIPSNLMTSAGRLSLMEGPSIPGVVASLSAEHDEFHPSLLALSHPNTDKSLSVSLTRLSGEPVYSGRASSAEDGLDIELRAARMPGSAAVAVRARLTDEGLEVSGRSGRDAAEPPQTPQRMNS